jgi:4'-phosphopantetheinyl transferase
MLHVATWNIAPASLPLAPDVLHVWRVRLSGGDGKISAAASLLSAEETARANRLVDETARRRFILSRAALRSVVARYLDQPPQTLAFRLGSHGKPHLASSTLRFNVSHAADLALIGVTSGSEVGVDVECMDARRPVQAIAARFFSPTERADLDRKSGPEHAATFFRIWSRKEAVIKALGEGLACPLDSFDVSSEPHEAHLLAFRREGVVVADWRLVAIDAAPHYVAAAAVIGPCRGVLGFDAANDPFLSDSDWDQSPKSGLLLRGVSIS